MTNRPIIAWFIIFLGLLMICAGFGYTVHQVSILQQDTTGTVKRKPHVSRDEAWLPRHSTMEEPALEKIPGDPEQKAYDNGKQPATVDFFFPALTLLSGAVLATAGAIALVHRYHGIGVVR